MLAYRGVMQSHLTMLTVSCPFCAAEHPDELECLESGRQHTMRCQNPACSRMFDFMIRECLACGEETVFTWKALPPEGITEALFCGSCGASFDEGHEDSEHEAAGWRVQ